MKKIIFIIIILLNSSDGLTNSPYIWDLIKQDSNYFMKVDNLDSMNLMALGNKYYAYKYVYKSSDAGMSWDTVYMETEDTIKHRLIAFDLAYPTKDYCIISCDSGVFIKSTDGGKTWKQTRTGYNTGNFGFRKVSMFDAKHGIISSGYDMIISHDGFETWDSVKLPERFLIGLHYMPSPEKIYLYCSTYSPFSQRFIKSFDAGKTWTEFPFPDPEPEFSGVRNMKFIDSLYGYIVGGERTGVGDNTFDRIFKTTNGGETWTKILDTLLKPPYGLQNLDILDRNNAIFVGSYGKIYWTHDGGNSFLYDSNSVIIKKLPFTMNVSIIGINTAIICDLDGRILRSSLVTNIGETIVESYYHISPNPASDYIEISVGAQRAVPVGVVIYDVLGIEVQKSMDSRFRGNDSHFPEARSVRIDVSQLPPGMYFIRAGDVMRKFIKI